MSAKARAGPLKPGVSLALTMGEPAGIGAEIAIAAWRARKVEDVPPFFLIADPRALNRLADTLGWALAMTILEDPGAAAGAFETSLPVLPLELPAEVSPGALDPTNAAAVLSAIETAVSLTHAGRAAAVVTGPIHKGVLYGAGFRHPGHTEFLAELDQAGAPPVMLLACPGLKVVPVTVHLPLKDAIAALRPDTIVHAGRITAAALTRDFGIAGRRRGRRPRTGGPGAGFRARGGPAEVVVAQAARHREAHAPRVRSGAPVREQVPRDPPVPRRIQRPLLHLHRNRNGRAHVRADGAARALVFTNPGYEIDNPHAVHPVKGSTKRALGLTWNISPIVKIY